MARQLNFREDEDIGKLTQQGQEYWNQGIDEDLVLPGSEDDESGYLTEEKQPADMKSLEDHRGAAELDHPMGSIRLRHFEATVRALLENLSQGNDKAILQEALDILGDLLVEGTITSQGTITAEGDLIVNGNLIGVSTDYVDGHFTATGRVGHSIASKWDIRTDGVITTHLPRTAIVMTGTGRLFVSGLAATSRRYSDDLGETWTSLPPGLGMLWLAYGNGTLLGATSNQMFRSVDDGETWAEIPAGDHGFDVNTINSLVHIGGDSFVAVGTNAHVGYSTDAGLTWVTEAKAVFTGEHLFGVAFGDGRIVACGNAAVIGYSTDGGSTWTAPSDSGGLNIDLRRVAYSQGRFVVAGTGDQVAYSTDGGQTFTLSSNAPSSIVAPYWVGGLVGIGNTFVAVGGRNVDISYDGAQTWEQWDIEPLSSDQVFRGILLSEEHRRIFAVGEGEPAPTNYDPFFGVSRFDAAQLTVSEEPPAGGFNGDAWIRRDGTNDGVHVKQSGAWEELDLGVKGLIELDGVSVPEKVVIGSSPEVVLERADAANRGATSWGEYARIWWSGLGFGDWQLEYELYRYTGTTGTFYTRVLHNGTQIHYASGSASLPWTTMTNMTDLKPGDLIIIQGYATSWSTARLGLRNFYLRCDSGQAHVRINHPVEILYWND